MKKIVTTIVMLLGLAAAGCGQTSASIDDGKLCKLAGTYAFIANDSLATGKSPDDYVHLMAATDPDGNYKSLQAFVGGIVYRGKSPADSSSLAEESMKRICLKNPLEFQKAYLKDHS